MTKLNKVQQFVFLLIEDYNNNRETSNEYVKDSIYKCREMEYAEWATRLASYKEAADRHLAKYNMRVIKGSTGRMSTLIRVEDYKQIELDDVDTNLINSHNNI